MAHVKQKKTLPKHLRNMSDVGQRLDVSTRQIGAVWAESKW